MAVSAGTVEIEFVTNLARIEGELSQIKRAVGQTMGEAVTQQNKVGAASNAMAAALEKQLATFGKSTAQIRQMQAAAQALAAEEAGLAAVAERIRSADAALTALQASEQRAAQEANKLAVEHARLAERVRASQAAQEADAAAAERMRAATDPLYAALQRINAQIAESTRLYHAGATAPEEYARQQAVLSRSLQATTAQHNAMAMAMGKNGFAIRQFAIQIPDIAQGLLTGQKPMTVFIQQGGQIAQIAMMADGGIAGFAKQLGGLALRFAPLVAVAGAAALAIKALAGEANDDASMKKYAESLGLSEKQIRKLKDVTVTWGDTAKAVFQVTGNAIASALGLSVDGVWSTMKDWLVWIATKTKDAANYLIGGFVGAYNLIGAAWKQFPTALGDIFYSAVQASIDAVNALIRAAVDGVNGYIASANGVLAKVGLNLPTLTAPQIAQVDNQYKGAAAVWSKTVQDEMRKAQSVDYVGNAASAIIAQAEKNARARIKKEATDKGYLDPKADRHAEQLARDAAAIEAQIKNLRALADAYAVSGAAALIAEAREKAESQAIRKRADIEAAVDRQIRLSIAQRVADAARSTASMRDQATIQDRVNAMVTAGLVPAQRAADLVRDQIADLPLLAAIQAAQQRGLADEAARATKALADQQAVREQLRAAEEQQRFNTSQASGSNQIAELQAELQLVGANDAARAHVLAVIKATQEAEAQFLDPTLRQQYIDQQVKIADLTQQVTEAQRSYNDALTFTADKWDLITSNVQDAASGLSDAFGSVGKALGDVATRYAQFNASRSRLDQEHGDRLKELTGNQAGIDRENAKFALQTATQQIDLYGDMAEAAKGFFSQNTAGYKAMEAAEKAFRAVEFALSVKSMAQDVAHTASSIANSAARVAAGAVEAVVNAIKSLPFPLNLAAGAATVAALGSIGVAIAGSFGGGGAKPTAPNEGKGTVLGDSDAQSASVTRAIQALQDIDAAGLAVSRDMLASLRSIESSIGGLSSLIVRAGDVNASAGVATGFKTNALGGTLDAILTGGGLLKGVPILGDILGGIGGVVKSLFGTKTTVTGSGIYGDAQSLGNILGGGFDASYYSDVQKKKKFFGITTGTSYSTQYTNASGEIEDQFTKILSSFYQAIDAAAGPLGLATSDVEQRLNSFVVNIGKIDLQGLTGQEISDKLTAVFGAAADNMANAVVPGLSRFQKVGEGAFETLIRVASTVEAVTTSLNHLGANARNLGVDAALGLSGLFDSVSDLTSAADSYFQNFYTPEEQAAAKMADLGKVFASLNLALPDSIAGYRALVDAQNLNTDAGRAAYAALLQLAPAFSDVVGSMQDATSAAAVVRERQDLERQLLQLQGDTTALRALDLSKLDASNRALQQQIWALTDQQAAAQAATQAEQALAQQRSSMEEQLLQLQGDTAELQRRQLEALDPSLRALQQQIWAAQAAQDAAQKAQQLADAWKSVGDSILDEINRIRGLAANDNGSSLAALQQQFDAATALARGGDQDAAGKLVGLSQSLLDAASNAARDQLQLNQIQSATAASLQQTYDMIQKAVGASDTSTGGSAGGSASDAAAWWAAFAANAPANSDNGDVVRELVSLRQEVAQLRSDNNDGNAQIAGPLKKMGRVVDDVTGQSGGSAVAVIVEAA